MTLFPREHMVLTTQLIPSEVAEVLRRNTVETLSLFRVSDKTFSGQVDASRFSVRRVLRDSHNSFVPQMAGVIIAENSGSKINVRLTLMPTVRLFMTLWFGFLFVVGPVCVVLGVAQIVSGDTEGAMMIGVPIGMLVFGMLVTHGAFRFEVPRSRKCLLEVLRATEIGNEEAVETDDRGTCL